MMLYYLHPCPFICGFIELGIGWLIAEDVIGKGEVMCSVFVLSGK